MSHLHGEALTDRQNVLDVFNKRFKMQEELSSSSAHATQDPSSVSLCKNKVRKFKAKRLKTRKERSQFRSLKGQQSKQNYHHYSRKEGKTSNCFICHSKCQKFPLSREALFGRFFSKQEPCIITDNRLTGHRGLFSHEVKSINIERLLSDHNKKTQKQENLDKLCARNNTVPPCYYLSPDPGPSTCYSPAPSPFQESQKKTKKGITKKNTKTGGSFILSSGKVEKTGLCISQQDSNIQVPCSLQGKIAVDTRILHLSENEIVFQSSSDSSDCEISNKCTMLKSLAVELDKDSLPSHDAERKRRQCSNTKLKTVTTSTPLQVPESSDILSHHRQCEAEINLESDLLTGVANSNTTQKETQQQPENYPVVTVALRLCHSLVMPLSRRGCLLAESREALLQALQERHGIQLQNNLHVVQHILGYNRRAGERDSRCIPSISNGGNDPDVEQTEPSLQNATCLRRRRKQKNPKKVEPQLFPESSQAENATAQWNSMPVMKCTGNVSIEELRPYSPEFFMDLQPSFDVFSPVPVAAHSGPQLPWAHHSNKGTTPVTVGEKCNSEMYFLSPTESFERNRKPSLKYTPLPLRDKSRDFKHRQLCSVDTEKSYVNENSSPFHCPPLKHYMQSPYPSHNATSTSKFYSLDMNHYPPSDMLENRFSPQKSSFPFYPSPELWSYPRMRLY